MDKQPTKVTEEQAAQTNAAEKNTAPKKKKHTARNIILIILAILVIGAILRFFVFNTKTEKSGKYTPYTVSTGTVSTSLSFNGSLEAIHNTTYKADGDSNVLRIYAAKGDSVKEGDYIMRLSGGQLVKAEFDGTINKISVDEDDHVSAGDELCQIVDFKHQKVSIRIDEYDIGSIHEGDACRVTTVATGQSFDSVVSNINFVSASKEEVAFYTADAYIDAPDGVYPGMQVSVTVPKEEAKDAAILKVKAISFDDSNRAFVYTKNSDGQYIPTFITPGVSNGSYVEIKDGLRSGDTVYAINDDGKNDNDGKNRDSQKSFSAIIPNNDRSEGSPNSGFFNNNAPAQHPGNANNGGGKQ